MIRVIYHIQALLVVIRTTLRHLEKKLLSAEKTKMNLKLITRVDLHKSKTLILKFHTPEMLVIQFHT